MKHILRLLLILVVPFSLFAQDTTVLKQQAQVVAHAVVDSNYSAIISHTYPKLVEAMGGKEKMLTDVVATMSQLKGQGVVIENASVGSPGKFYKAGTEIHCLVPETVVLKIPGGHVTAQSYLLAVSGDGGLTWSFIDLNENTRNLIPNILPNFNPDLKIPAQAKPLITKD